MLSMLPDPRPYFAELPDPRRETRNQLHLLHDIAMIVLCAVLGGVEDWVGREDFANEKEAWLGGFLELPNGIILHDTLSDVLGRIAPAAFARRPSPPGRRRPWRGGRGGTTPATHLMSAFAARARWVLAQEAVAEKTNEINVITDLLAMLDRHGAVVSIAAMGCQKAIAQASVDAGADDVLVLKDNHPTVCEDVQLWLDTEVACGRLLVQATLEKDHGRIEIRRYALSAQIDWLDTKPAWAGLQAVGRVESHSDHRRPDQYGMPLFPGLVPGSGLVRGHRPQPVGDRKPTALGLGRAIRRGCLPGPAGPLRRKPGSDTPPGPQPAEPPWPTPP